MLLEIGSEFCHLESTNKAKSLVKKGDKDSAYLLSGRTALDFIIKDIKTTLDFSKVILPSYCCESMIDPFKKNGIAVQFYPVSKNGIEYFENDADAVLLIDYFGYENSRNKEIADDAKNAGKIVIYDATHKINSLDYSADYVFCSFRKWFYSNSAVAIKNIGNFAIEKPRKTNVLYVEKRDKASNLKKEYLNSGVAENKPEFLELYSEAEAILEKDYLDYCGIFEEFDINSMIESRRKNAIYLVDKLKMIPDIKVWNTEIGDEDAPLFVPIFVEAQKRDALKKWLIQNSIFCPVHWPISEKHGEYKEIYNEELSIICDQRYTLEDMERVASVISSFFESRGDK